MKTSLQSLYRCALCAIAGAIYLMPKHTADIKSGKRATFVLMTIFLISLQDVFFELFPLAVTDGSDTWSW